MRFDDGRVCSGQVVHGGVSAFHGSVAGETRNAGIAGRAELDDAGFACGIRVLLQLVQARTGDMIDADLQAGRAQHLDAAFIGAHQQHPALAIHPYMLESRCRAGQFAGVRIVRLDGPFRCQGRGGIRRETGNERNSRNQRNASHGNPRGQSGPS